MKKRKRKVDILGNFRCTSGYLWLSCQRTVALFKSIKPKAVILNGDIIDIWQFSKNYWPKSHMKVVKHLFSWIGKGLRTYYITGNHDEMLRKFVGLKMGIV